ncbi:hypothetical protein C9426_29480, partial [Serratia sp. S1B]
FNSFSQFGSQCLEFLFVHNLPVSVVRKNIPKTGNYTISFTVSFSVVIRQQSVLIRSVIHSNNFPNLNINVLLMEL